MVKPVLAFSAIVCLLVGAPLHRAGDPVAAASPVVRLQQGWDDAA